MSVAVSLKFADPDHYPIPNPPPQPEEEVAANITLIGGGGAGGNGIDRMVAIGVPGVKFIAMNTDAQALRKNSAPIKLQLGGKITGGRGTGARPEIGRKAAEEDADRIRDLLIGTELLILCVGQGGGTGTGAAPVIAEIARSMDILTVAIVTKPFEFEGRRRMAVAEAGIKELREIVDTLLVIPNQLLLDVVEEGESLLKAFEIADSILAQAARGISDTITVPGIINLDFADINSVMSNGGDALLGIGAKNGEDRAVKAAEEAIKFSLIENASISGAQSVLVNITGSKNMGLHEVNEAMSIIHKAAGENANVIFGVVINEDAGDEFRVTVIATNFRDSSEKSKAKMVPDNNVNYQEKLKLEPKIPAFIRRDRKYLEQEPKRESLPRKEIVVDFDGAIPSDISIPSTPQTLSQSDLIIAPGLRKARSNDLRGNGH